MKKLKNLKFPFASLSLYNNLSKEYANKKIFTYHNDNNDSSFLTGKSLTEKVMLTSSKLQKLLKSQEKAIILLPQGLAYINSLLACFHANVIAVPTSVTSVEDIDRIIDKILPIFQDSNPKCIITDRNFKKLLKENNNFSSVSILCIDELGDNTVQDIKPRRLKSNDTALLLYTSGSTAKPKGVILTHDNVKNQVIQATKQWGIKQESCIVSWMPQFHSFGLFFNFMGPLLEGASSIILPPDSFVRNPYVWFETINKYQATHIAAPNFAFDYCYSSIDISKLNKISLSSLRAIICGGEPIRKETYENFTERFQVLGLKNTIFCPHYGMSEVGSVTTVRPNKAIRFLALDIPSLEKGIVKLSNDINKSKFVSSCGVITKDVDILCVHPETRNPCSLDEVGEIWVKSPSVAKGYFNQPEETEKTFAGTLKEATETGFFRTGDLGFIREKHLYIIGREKEVIISNGKNYHPVDIEWSIKKKLPDLTLPVCVFSSEFEKEEKIIVVQETEVISDNELQKLSQEILDSVAETYMLEIHEVFLVKKGMIPKTGSGKIQRKNCRNLYKEDKLFPLYQYRTGFSKKQETATIKLDQDLEKELLTRLKNEVFSYVLNIESDMLEDTKSFGELGFDSIKYIKASKKIEEVFTIQFAPVMLFKHRTIEKLTKYLSTQVNIAEVTDKQEIKVEKVSHQKVNIEAEDTEIAVIGISCNFPGESNNPELFWKNIVGGTNCISSISENRSQVIEDYKSLYGNASDLAPKWGGFIKGVDQFDARFFGISPLEAESMDPQQRKVLELTWKVIEDGGYDPASLADSDTGLFIGVHSNDYAELILKRPDLIDIYGAYVDSGLHMSMISHRASRWFNFHGPSEVINTACSSSLVSIHRAIESINKNECTLAIAGGINLILSSRTYIASHKAGMLSKDGHCKTFDDKADGFVRSEGYGAVLLKPYKQALKDKDTIYGIIKGTAINHDGQSNSLRAPNLNAQKRLIKSAYKAAGVPANTISYIETHGTGTSLGDPIEFQALKEAFHEIDASADGSFCGLGAVKTIIGHSESAAGIAGVIKVLLSMKAKTLPGIIHFNKLNKYISLENTPFYIVDKNQEWKRLKNEDDQEIPRRAGISSFGFGGANAHILVEEHVSLNDVDQNPAQNHKVIIPLSAKNKERLLENVQNLIDYLEKKSHRQLNLIDIAYTLQVGRNAMEERVAFLVQNLEELKEKMRWFLEGKKNIKECWSGENDKRKEIASQLGNDEDSQELIEKWLTKNKLDQITQCWVQGATIKWDVLYTEDQPNRINLPTYAFAETRYWIPESTPILSNSYDKNFSETIHPLVHKNTSDLTAQKFSSIFTGSEFFLSDHIVKGQKVLPGAICLEMARVSFEKAARDLENKNEGITIKDIFWNRPMIVGKQDKEVHIALYPRENNQVDYEIYTSSSHNPSDPIIHNQGLLEFKRLDTSLLNLDSIRNGCDSSIITSAQLYDRFSTEGIEYGASFRAVEEIYIGKGIALAKLNLSFLEEESFNQFVLHPGILDAALHASSVLVQGEDQPLALPYSIKELEIHASSKPEMWVKITHCNLGSEQEKINTYNIELCDNEGRVCVDIKELTVVSVENDFGASTGEHQGKTLMFKQEWKEQRVSGEENNVEYDEHLMVFIEPEQDCIRELTKSKEEIQILILQSQEIAIEERYLDYTLKVFETLQKVSNLPSSSTVLIQIIASTTGQQKIFGGLAAMLKTAYQEHPNIIGQFIGVDSWKELTTDVLNKNGNRPWEAIVTYKNEQRYIPSWHTIKKKTKDPIDLWKNDGVYLITGGMGGLGFLLSNEIIQKTEKAVLILTGRSSLNDEKKKKIEQLEQQGTNVVYKQADIAQKRDVDKLIQDIVEHYGKLNAIIHSAGVIRDNYIIKKTETEIREVLASKVNGTINLDKASEGLSLDFLILFSSIAGSLGNPGQVDYAAANAFMDHFSDYRNDLVVSNKRSGNTLSINWPLWEEGGMQVSTHVESLMKQNMGMLPMKSSIGIESLYHAYASGKSQVMVINGDEEKIKTFIDQQTSGKLLQNSVKKNVFSSLLNISEELLEEKAVLYFKNLLSSIIRLPAKEIYADVPMETYGIDSIMVMQLTSTLEKTFGVLSKTLFFEYKNIKALTRYFLEAYKDQLIDLIGVNEEAKDTVAVQNVDKDKIIPQQKSVLSNKKSRFSKNNNLATKEKSLKNEDIAIIGLAGRYPDAQNIYEFWEVLKEGKDCISEIPKDRWDYNLYFSEDKNAKDKTYTKWGGFIDGVDEFDPLFFNISPREAEMIDPQERLFLQCVNEAIEDAGYSRENIIKSKEGNKEGDVGVFVGVMFEEYQLYGAQEQARGRSLAISGNIASIANRVSYYYNFHGPSMAVDTMCSSSLSALHLACQSLHNSDCSLAIAGGVNVSIHPNKYLLLAQGKFASTHGKCKSFGNGGDGYVPGEGVGTVVLKPMSKAIEDGNHIYGVIKSTAINHGGKTNGYTVPNPNAQADVIEKTLKTAEIDPRTIGYLEAHGTGTALGDPIEITGLIKAYRKHTSEKQFCAIGSVKSNIGHCESAAGMAGITKILMQMKHRQLVPSLHSKKLNPNINFTDSPFVVQQDLEDWSRITLTENGRTNEYPRRAGLSSFGAGGSNAHVIFEEYIPVETRTTEIRNLKHDPAIILLSAKEEERLKEQAENLLKFIENREFLDDDLIDIAYTLQVGRTAMEERMAMIVTSVSQLKDNLASYLDANNENVYCGHVTNNRPLVEVLGSDDDIQKAIKSWISKRKYGKLLDLWVAGFEIDWDILYGHQKPKKVSLPVYPFARERYWIPQVTPDENVVVSNHINTYQHPLIHENTSNFGTQKFSSTFTGTEFFLRDHVIKGQKILPGAVYIEMVREAIERSGIESEKNENVIVLKNILWTRPFVVKEQPLRIHTALYPENTNKISFKVYNTSETVNNEELVYNQGLATLHSAETRPRLNLVVLKEQCSSKIIASETYYTIFNQQGLQYGPAHQCINKVYLGKKELVAKLALSSVSDIDKQFYIHPALMDAAFQASLGLMIAEDTIKLALPIAIQEVEIYNEFSSVMWAHIRYSNDSFSGDTVQKYDIDICDDIGNVCVRLKSFSTKIIDDKIPSDKTSENINEESQKGELMLVPQWNEIERQSSSINVEKLLVSGGTEVTRLSVLKQYPHAEILEIELDDSIENIENRLKSFNEIGHVFWIAPENPEEQAVDDSLVEQQEQGVLQVYKLIKACQALEYSTRSLEWSILSFQALTVKSHENIYPAHASLHGLIGSMAKEYPNWKVRMLDIENNVEWSVQDVLSFPSDPKGNVYAFRSGKWYTEKLIPLHLPSNKQPVSAYKNKGVYVVIGGSGGIGEAWSEYMIRTYMAHIIWIGRREISAEIQSKLDRLEKLGQRPEYISADAANQIDLQRSYEKIKQKYTQIHGVIHSAIVLADKSLANMEEEQFRKVLSVKVDVSVNIAKVFGQEQLDFILFFSSMNSFEKLAGQSNYTAGCTFKDAFATHLSQQIDCAVKVINWGFWGSVGVVASEIYRELMAQAGVGSIEPQEAMKMLEILLSNPIDQLAYIKTTKPFAIDGVNWEESIELKKTLDQDTSLLGEVNKNIKDQRVIVTQNETMIRYRQKVSYESKNKPVLDKKEASEGPIKKTIKQKETIAFQQKESKTKEVTKEELREKCTAYLSTIVGEILKIPSHKIDPSKPLGDYGIDSVLIIQLTSTLGKMFHNVTSTLLYDYQSVKTLVAYFIQTEKDNLITILELEEETSQKEETPVAPSFSKNDLGVTKNFSNNRFWDHQNKKKGQNQTLSGYNMHQDVAIIGLAGKYAEANNIDEFWNNLKEGKNCISEIPADRWDWKKYFSEEKGKTGKMYTKWAGFIKDIDKFDPLFFRITPKEAALMDPQERLFLEVVYECMENAGYTPQNLSQSRKVGVFAGVMNESYRRGTHYWSIANRVSYLMNFQGPSMVIDTACSSSLTAIYQALESIYSGVSECAIAGGVNLIVNPVHLTNLSSMRMLSAGDKLKAFGEHADGFVDGEGVGAIILKPLNKAKEDGDHIYGVIKGCMINSGGKTHGYTVPNPKLQSQLVADTLKRANVDARDISYIEAHGTGTALGDPIEISGLTQAFEQQTKEKQFCAIGSVKTNIGHCESAAGIAGLTKILLQMKHGKLVPSLHSKTLNPNIDFEKTPFKVQQELAEWKRPLIHKEGITSEYPRMASLSSFGAGGSNAHIIIEEYIFEKTEELPIPVSIENPAVIILSAREEDRLKEKAKRLLKELEDKKIEDKNLHSIAYTLQIGRETMESRLGIVVTSVAELKYKLQGFIDRREDIENVYTGSLKREKQALAVYKADEDLQRAIDLWVEDKKYDKLLGFWVKGLAFEWEKLYKKLKPQKMPLPTYPFLRERYWKSNIDAGVYTNIGSNGVDVISVPEEQKIQEETEIKQTSEIQEGKEYLVKDMLKRETINYLKKLISSVSYIPINRIESEVSLEAYGIDSIMIKSLLEELEKSFESLSLTIFFEYQDIKSLAEYFISTYPEELKKIVRLDNKITHKIQDNSRLATIKTPQVKIKKHQPSGFSSSQINGSSMNNRKDEDIAVIGLSGKYPEAKNINEFWENLKTGKDCVGEIPKERWDYTPYFDEDRFKEGKINSKWGGFVDDIDKFDPLFFNISPEEAEMMDPQERLFLQCVYETIEDAGYTRETLSKYKNLGLEGNIGVFVGVTFMEYHLYGIQSQLKGKPVAFSGIPSSIANRVSYFCNFHGPSMSVDSMCSSSLTALNLACDSIKQGRSKLAVVGGVNLSLHPNKYLFLSQYNFLSSKGRCESFGNGGDGYVPGEGVGAILLKPLSQAEADGDQIYGIIKSTTINHGGKTNGYSVPNPVAQTNAIRNAIKDAQVNPRTISYIEAHGTGTSLGDPIEIAGISKAFNEYTNDKDFCAIGSAKSNIGHLEAAAGIAGITKVLLQIKHKQLVPSLHSEVINSNINFNSTPFKVQQKLEEWNRPVIEVEGIQKEYPRIAGISSFGAGGGNAHVIIEEYIPKNETQNSIEISVHKPALIVLSAKKEEQLRQQVERILKAIDTKQVQNKDLASMAYTLQVGREAMDERLAVIVTSLQDLKEKLEGYLHRKIDLIDLYRSQGKKQKNILTLLRSNEELQEAVDKWIERKKYSVLLDLWVAGMEVDWEKLYPYNKPKKISLPTYPFTQERYWHPELEVASIENYVAGKQVVNYIHPLIHKNTSNLEGQRYSSKFTGNEPFLKEYAATGEKILSESAYLEMVRVSIDEFVPEKEERRIQLKEIIWSDSILITTTNDQDVHISLYPEEEGNIGFEIYSGKTNNEEEIVIHCQGFAVIAPVDESSNPEIIDLQEIQDQCNSQIISAKQNEDFLKILGLDTLYIGVDKMLLKIKEPNVSKEYMLFPEVLETVINTAQELIHDKENVKKWIPVALEELEIINRITAKTYAVITRSSIDKNHPIQKFDIDLCTESGEILAKMKSLVFEATDVVNDNHHASISDIMVQTAWKKSSALQHIKSIKIVQRDILLCEASQVIKPSNIETRIKEGRCHILRSEAQDLDVRYEKYAEQLFTIVKNKLKTKPKGKILIQLVLLGSGEDKEVFRGLAGLLKTAQLENSKLLFQMIELSENSSTEDDIVYALEENTPNLNDKEVKYERGVRYVKKLKEVSLIADEQREKLPWKEGGVYLLTGGAGGLGMIFAEEIVQKVNGVHLILTGRSKLKESKQNQLNTLRSFGASVAYKRVDINDNEQVIRLLTGILESYGKLHGIVHVAGITRDNFIINKSKSEFVEVLKPKVAGVVNLDNSSRDIDLDFMCLFSSRTAEFGNQGQADYAVANAFLDNYSAYRNNQVEKGICQGKTVTINWPLWEKGGMHVDREIERIMFENTGMTPMKTTTGIQFLYKALSQENHCVMIMEGDVDKIRKHTWHSSINEEKQNQKNPSCHSLVDDIEGVNSGGTEVSNEDVLHKLTELFGKNMKLSVDKINVEDPLDSYGVDSIKLTLLNKKLAEHFGDISNTVFFEYDTLEALGEFLTFEYPQDCITWLGKEKEIQKENKTRTSLPKRRSKAYPILSSKKKPELNGLADNRSDEPIAVIGVSGRFPKANTINEFWENLKKGKDCITEIPKERWGTEGFYNMDREEAVTNKQSYSKWGGFLDGFADFDPLFFNISPAEAERIDPQERIFLQECWKAIEDAGYVPSKIDKNLKKQIGVFGGITKTGFSLWNHTTNKFYNTSFSSLVNRVSYFMDFHGPSVPVDTMCSSSLVALHQACESIRHKQIKMAIVGAVNLYLHPSNYTTLSQAGLISDSPQNTVFGEGGVGFVPSEGVGAVVLKPLSEAEKDNDNILAVIRGSAVSHSGKTNGYNIPDPAKQADVIRQVLTTAKVDPRTIKHIETAASGSEMVDAIEMSALSKVYKQYRDKDNEQYTMGSIKTVLGHGEAVSGMSQFIKAILQLNLKMICPSNLPQKLNPNINLDTLPFKYETDLVEWSHLDIQGEKVPRRIGINSFGAGGVYAHLILEAYESTVDRNKKIYPESIPNVFVISAKTTHTLKKYLKDWKQYLMIHPELDMNQLVYILQTKREPMKKRFACIAENTDEVISKIESYLKGEVNENSFIHPVQGDHKQLVSLTKNNDDQIDRLISDKDIVQLARLWVSGASIPWERIYGIGTFETISQLPTYPFRNKKFWINAEEEVHLEESKNQNFISLDDILRGQQISSESTEVDAMSESETSWQPETNGSENRFISLESYLQPLDKTDADNEINDNQSKKEEIQQLIREIVSRILYLDDLDELDNETNFIELGLDSILTSKFVQEINNKLDLNIKETTIFDYPNTLYLAEYIVSKGNI